MKRRVHGRSGADLECNQIQFMQLMGLVDSIIVFDDRIWECGIHDDEPELLITASAHTYHEKIRLENQNDGYIFEDFWVKLWVWYHK